MARSKRKRKTASSRKVFYIATEGSVTERKYFDALVRHYNLRNVRLLKKARTRSSPSQVIERLERQMRSRKDDFGVELKEEYWAVFDTDKSTAEALVRLSARARRKQIQLAASNPCFELWLLLHHNSLDKYKRLEASGDTAKCTPSSKALEQIDPTYDPDKKGKWDALPYMDMVDTAMENAERADRTQPDEPLKRLGSRVYKMVDSIIKSPS